MSFEMSNIKIGNNNYEIKDAKARSQIKGLASGSPLGASSIEEMTDTTKIYVNTTDGNWYYYNDSEWVIGGVYQAIELDDKSVSYNKLFDNLSGSLEPICEIVDNTFIKGYYAPNGTHALVDETNQYLCLEMNVTPGETYHLVGRFYHFQNVYTICDSENNVLSSYKVDSTTSEGDIIFSIPKNATKVYINVYGLDEDQKSNFPPLLTKIIGYRNSKPILKTSLEENLQKVFIEKYEEIDIEWLSNGYYGVDASKHSGGTTSIEDNNYKFAILDVTPGEKYKISGIAQFKNIPLIAFLTNTIQKNSTYDNSTIGEYKTKIPENQTGTITIENEIITIPEWCNKIVVNNVNNSAKVEKLNSYGVDNSNPLNDKTLLFTGDSICAGYGVYGNAEGVSGEYYDGWAKRIEENNPTANCINYGIGGTTIAKRTDRTDSILERINEMQADADYIIFQGGVNDVWTDVAIGEITNGYNDTYDETTFTGALEKCFRTAQLKWKGKKIGYIVTHKIGGVEGLENFMERAKEVCKKWSISYIDLFNESGLNCYLDEINNEYFQIQSGQTTGDRCHPNPKGYEVITPKIESWIKSL